jgi:hypothetical protein
MGSRRELAEVQRMLRLVEGGRAEAQRMLRLVDACENIAAELERLRLLKEHELGVRVEHADGDPYVKVIER